MQSIKPDYSLIISTCDKFSDLRDAHVKLLEENWADRNVETFLVTDKSTDKTYPNVKVVCAGEGSEITERLTMVLQEIHTDYVFFTLDDYFLTEKIDNEAILRTLDFMKDENADYLMLHPIIPHVLKREDSIESKRYKGFFFRNVNKGDYMISLYPGVWRTDFMRDTIQTKLNAWQYEVALTVMARECKAACAVSNNLEFPFLDVIRKGKVLRKANRYFQKNPVYQSERQIMRAKDEWMIEIRTWMRHWLPRPLFRWIKRMMSKQGQVFYSPVE